MYQGEQSLEKNEKQINCQSQDLLEIKNICQNQTLREPLKNYPWP